MAALGHSRPSGSRPTPIFVRYAPKATIQGTVPNCSDVPIASFCAAAIWWFSLVNQSISQALVDELTGEDS
jgi:hypothetical protein